MLRLSRGALAEICRHSVHVDLADHGAAVARRKRETEKCGEAVLRRHELQKALASQRGVVVGRAESQPLGIAGIAAELALADVAAPETLLGQVGRHHLAKVGELVAGQDVVRGDVADQPGQSAVLRDPAQTLAEQLEKLLVRVGAPGAASMVPLELHAAHQTAGIDLDLVGTEVRIREEPIEVLEIGGGARSVQVRHPVDVELEPGAAQQAERPPRRRDVVPAAVLAEHLVREALDADLHLGASEAANPQHLLRTHAVGPRLEGEPDTAARTRFVGALRLLERFPVRWLGGGGELGDLAPPVDTRTEVVQRLERAPHEPDLVGLGVERPGAAQDDQLDLRGEVPHAPVGEQAVPGLAVGIEFVGGGALAAGLIGQIALGHSVVGRAEDALPGAREGSGQHCDGRHAGDRPGRAGAELLGEGQLECPVALRSRALPEGREDLALRVDAPPFFRMTSQDPIQRARVDALAGDHLVDDRVEFVTPAVGL